MSAIGPLDLTTLAQAIFEENPLSRFPLDLIKSDTTLTEIPQYLFCNEKDQFATLSELEFSPPVHNSLHIGFSCWFNLDIIAMRQPKVAIICDIDPEIIKVLDLIQNTVAHCDTKEAFKERFWNILDDYEPHVPIKEHELSWLKSDESYETIKEMYQMGKIAHLQTDILDNENLSKIQSWAKENELTVDTLYLSNIEEWLLYNFGDTGRMQENISPFIQGETKVLSAWKKQAQKGSPLLHLTKGEYPTIVYEKPKKTRSRLGNELPRSLGF